MNHQNPSAKAEKTSKGILGAGLLTAFAASLCCITPVLALFSGATGIASTFSWMEPYRPYLIGITIAVLAFAWYQKLKPKKAEIDCACEEDKPSFWKSKKFLAIVTILAFLLMAFPSYSNLFFPKTPATQVVVVNKNNLQQVKLNITGMDCQACSQTINLALSNVPGVLKYNTDYQQASSTVMFDQSKTTQQAIVKSVNETGYTVAGITNVKQ
ncbi:MAG: mercuric transport protein MerTP [Bacteroidota bacterium]|nr:mercuric transport protein MerTP [Bacteroidota bacterium]